MTSLFVQKICKNQQKATRISEHNKVAGYKVNTQKLVSFPYISSKQIKFESYSLFLRGWRNKQENSLFAEETSTMPSKDENVHTL